MNSPWKSPSSSPPTVHDQEYTALMASIEEIQGLMEAEVAGAPRYGKIPREIPSKFKVVRMIWVDFEVKFRRLAFRYKISGGCLWIIFGIDFLWEISSKTTENPWQSMTKMNDNPPRRWCALTVRGGPGRVRPTETCRCRTWICGEICRSSGTQQLLLVLLCQINGNSRFE